MNVEPYDSAGRYTVTSESRKDVSFLCDLARSQCTCEDWHYRAATDPAHQCKHLRAARAIFTADLLRALGADAAGRTAEEWTEDALRRIRQTDPHTEPET